MRRVLLHILFWLTYVLALAYLNITNDVTSFQLLPAGALELFYQQLVIQLILLIVKLPFAYAALALLNRYLNKTIAMATLITLLCVLLVVSAVAMSVLNHKVVLPYFLR